MSSRRSIPLSSFRRTSATYPFERSPYSKHMGRTGMGKAGSRCRSDSTVIFNTVFPKAPLGSSTCTSHLLGHLKSFMIFASGSPTTRIHPRSRRGTISSTAACPGLSTVSYIRVHSRHSCRVNTRSHNNSSMSCPKLSLRQRAFGSALVATPICFVPTVSFELWSDAQQCHGHDWPPSQVAAIRNPTCKPDCPLHYEA